MTRGEYWLDVDFDRFIPDEMTYAGGQVMWIASSTGSDSCVRMVKVTWSGSDETSASGSLMNTASIQATHDGGDITTECSAVVDVLDNEIVCLKEVSKDGITFKDSIGIAPGQLAWFRVTISNPGASDFYTHSLTDCVGTVEVEIEIGFCCCCYGATSWPFHAYERIENKK